MKNYYELTKSERKKYFKEFTKTPVGKEMNFRLICLIIMCFCAAFITGFVSGYTYDLEISKQTEIFIDSMNVLAFILLCMASIYDVYIKLNFTSWLKNKHDVKRW